MLLLAGCSSSSKVVLVFENKTSSMTDSVVLFVDDYKCTLYHIPPDVTVTKEISRDSIHIIPHDITVRAETYLLGKKFEGMSYNDLSGNPAGSYIITLIPAFKVQIIANY